MGTLRIKPACRPAPGACGLLAGVTLLFLGALPSGAFAGSLCGTVRDAATAAPVADAGVFLRRPDGAYTGYHGATDASGRFCIHFVPPGAYDVEVLVEDYRVAYLRNVIVTGDVTDVPVSVATGGLDFRRPYPSPAESGVTFQWFLPVAGSARLAVFDARGRLMSAWSGNLAAGTKSVAWDLRDTRGIRVPAGVYYVRLESGTERRVRRFVCLP